jgi:hypothetical protein
MKAEGCRRRDKGVTMSGERGMTRRRKKRQIVQASPDLLRYWNS